MSGTDDFPLPSSLENSFSDLFSETTPYTLANILETAILACALGKIQPEYRYNIVNRVWFLFLDYSPVGEDSDIYQLRYGRLRGEIENQLSYIKRTYEANNVPDTEWTKLIWLLEDQQKILP